MTLRRFEIACWVIPNDSANSSSVSHESSASNTSNSESSKKLMFEIDVLDIKITAFETLKPLMRRSFTKSSLAVSTWENSMSHSRSFLLMKAENQNFPQMTRICLENWHRRPKIKLCKRKFTNVVPTVMLTDIQAYFVRFLICLFRPALTATAIYRKSAEAKFYT